MGSLVSQKFIITLFSVIIVTKTMIFGKNGKIFVLLSILANLGVLKCIPGVKLPKYTYTLIRFNIVAPSPYYTT